MRKLTLNWLLHLTDSASVLDELCNHGSRLCSQQLRVVGFVVFGARSWFERLRHIRLTEKPSSAQTWLHSTRMYDGVFIHGRNTSDLPDGKQDSQKDGGLISGLSRASWQGSCWSASDPVWLSPVQFPDRQEIEWHSCGQCRESWLRWRWTSSYSCLLFNELQRLQASFRVVQRGRPAGSSSGVVRRGRPAGSSSGVVQRGRPVSYWVVAGRSANVSCVNFFWSSFSRRCFAALVRCFSSMCCFRFVGWCSDLFLQICRAQFVQRCEIFLCWTPSAASEPAVALADDPPCSVSDWPVLAAFVSWVVQFEHWDWSGWGQNISVRQSEASFSAFMHSTGPDVEGFRDCVLKLFWKRSSLTCD